MVSEMPGLGAVGIVLVNYNGMRFMPDCLGSLMLIDYQDTKIVVVDNASTDGSPEWVSERYPTVALIRLATNRGVTGGNNVGMNWCLANGCDYILLLNPDTVVEADFLSKMLVYAGPNTLVVPRIYFYDNRDLLNSHVGRFDFWRGVSIEWFYGRPDTRESNHVQIVTMANTCAMLVPRQVVQRIGVMDEAYFMYYDDIDFVTRAVKQGVVVKFVPEAIIYHRESSSSGGQRISPLTMYYNTRNRLYFMFRHQPNRLALTFFLVYFSLGRLAIIAYCLLRGEFKLAVSLVRGVEDFIRGKMGYAPVSRFS